MVDIGTLPAIGAVPWTLNPALTAIKAELDGRLGAAQLSTTFMPYAAQALFPITAYGAQQGVFLTDAAMTSGSNVLTTAHVFTSADVGKVIGVRGAGPVSTDYTVLANDGVLVTTIASVSGGVATLTHAASTTCTGARAVFGTPIDTALTAAVAAAAVNGGNVFFPAGIWVAATQVKFPLRVGFTGAGKIKSRVYYVHSDDGSDYNVTPWLACRADVDPASGKKPAVSISNFCADGQFFVGTAGYSFRAKLIIADNTVDSYVSNMAILNSPATAIGWDISERCIIEGNTVVNAGRFAYVNNDRGGTSGSGIGVVVNNVSDNVSIVIRDNFLFGNWTSKNGTGRCGVNIEGVWENGTDVMEGSHIVTGNVVEGFFSGIRDSGSLSTRIIGNDVRKCQVGILLGSHSGALTARVPLSTIVMGNVVREGVKYNLITDAAVASTGIEVSSWRTVSDASADGRVLISGNQVFGIPGHGVYVNGNPYVLKGVKVADNIIRDNTGTGVTVSGQVDQSAVTGNYIERNGSYGIRLGGTLKNVTVAENEVYGNCLTGGTYGISVAGSTTWTGGKIVGNQLADLATTPTQTNTINIEVGAALTNVRRFGNTDDQTITRLYKQTGADTTITNTTTLTAVAGGSITVEPGKTYVLEAQINYTSPVAAGAKFNWTFPSGTAAAWSITGQGASVAVISQTGSANVAGVDSATSIAARVTGRFTVGSTGGTVQLNAAQVTPTTDNLVVKSGTFIEARPAN